VEELPWEPGDGEGFDREAEGGIGPMTDIPLADRMDALAVNHLRADELRDKAKALREGTAGFYAEPQTITVQSFVGRWARARRLWCDITGESLI
jgi:hypothetical protein